MNLSLFLNPPLVLLGVLCLGLLAAALAGLARGGHLNRDSRGIFAIMIVLVIAFIALAAGGAR